MPTNIRLKKEEQRDLWTKCIEINKILSEKEKRPLNESDLTHEILKKCIRKVKIDKNGEIYIED